jgi:hypothetical protein
MRVFFALEAQVLSPLSFKPMPDGTAQVKS